jgi:hypothetical protein
LRKRQNFWIFIRILSENESKQEESENKHTIAFQFSHDISLQCVEHGVKKNHIPGRKMELE